MSRLIYDQEYAAAVSLLQPREVKVHFRKPFFQVGRDDNYPNNTIR